MASSGAPLPTKIASCTRPAATIERTAAASSVSTTRKSAAPMSSTARNEIDVLSLMRKVANCAARSNREKPSTATSNCLGAGGAVG
jgi:hypothetical protein